MGQPEHLCMCVRVCVVEHSRGSMWRDPGVWAVCGRVVVVVSQVFEEGSVGQVPGGGSLSTYQELCSLATELGQPDLVYKFMDLAHHQQVRVVGGGRDWEHGNTGGACASRECDCLWWWWCCCLTRHSTRGAARRLVLPAWPSWRGTRWRPMCSSWCPSFTGALLLLLLLHSLGRALRWS